jgi:hypothetical protein
MPHHPVSFRCKECGFLERPENAGENLLPHACPNCGGGVCLSPGVKEIAVEMAKPDLTAERRAELAAELTRIATGGSGDKTYHPDNWEVLDEADDARLAELGLAREHVMTHKPEKVTQPRSGRVVTASVSDGVGAKTKAEQK